jgi:hypothetical protein
VAKRIFRCDDCDHVMTEAEILRVTVPHPKYRDRPIYLNQCPECGECQNFTNMCDEPGCKERATSGWPTAGGDYRHTCFDHNADAQRIIRERAMERMVGNK